VVVTSRFIKTSQQTSLAELIYWRMLQSHVIKEKGGHLVDIKFRLHSLKEDRLTPSCETALIGLANKAYSGKIFCACTSGFELPDSDMVISILYSRTQVNFSICNKQISRMSVINHKIRSSNKLNNFLGLLQPGYHLVFVIDKWQPCNY